MSLYFHIIEIDEYGNINVRPGGIVTVVYRTQVDPSVGLEKAKSWCEERGLIWQLNRGTFIDFCRNNSEFKLEENSLQRQN